MKRTRGPHYHVRLSMGGGTCYHVRVPVKPRQRLPELEIERRAVNLAVGTFGQRARTWSLLDAERRTR